jgi:hypothetical protein
MTMRGLLCVAAAAFIMGAGASGVSARQAPPSAPARLEGAWVRTDPDGSDSFGGLGRNIPAARIKPGVSAAGGGGRGRGGRGGRAGGGADTTTGPHDVGDPYIVVAQPCGGGRGRSGGALLINPDSGGVHFVVSEDEVIFAGERGGVRHIYTDGRPHPSDWVPTGAGHSIGHWEGDVLVADTVGLTPGAVPGGGMRSAATHLVERFKVAPDGKTLNVSYTWNDPAIYEQPHTYGYIFDRAPGNPPYAMEEWCDASDPIEKQSIVPPKQIIK